MVTAERVKALVIGNYKSRAAMVQGLQRTEAEVVETTACLHGLRHLIYEKPNIVVIGTNRTDHQVIRLLRAARCLTAAPIIVMGPGTDTDVMRSLLNGADAYLPQSCGPTTTLAYARALLSRN